MLFPQGKGKSTNYAKGYFRVRHPSQLANEPCRPKPLSNRVSETARHFSHFFFVGFGIEQRAVKPTCKATIGSSSSLRLQFYSSRMHSSDFGFVWGAG